MIGKLSDSIGTLCYLESNLDWVHVIIRIQEGIANPLAA